VASTNTLPVKVASRKKEGREFWEGQVAFPGLRPSKLVRKADNTTEFGTRAAVLASARSFAKRFGFSGVEATGKLTVRTTAKK